MNVILYFKDSKRIYQDNIDCILHLQNGHVVLYDSKQKINEYDTKELANIIINDFESED